MIQISRKTRQAVHTAMNVTDQVCHGRTASTMTVKETNRAFAQAKLKQKEAQK